MDFPLKGQWRGALVFSLIRGCTYRWASNRDAGDLKRHHAHYDVTTIIQVPLSSTKKDFKYAFFQHSSSHSTSRGPFSHGTHNGHSSLDRASYSVSFVSSKFGLCLSLLLARYMHYSVIMDSDKSKSTLGTGGDYKCNIETWTWKRFPNYWYLVREIHPTQMDSPLKSPVIRSLDIWVLRPWKIYWPNVAMHGRPCDVGVISSIMPFRIYLGASAYAMVNYE